jgi:hypothetical protein
MYRLTLVDLVAYFLDLVDKIEGFLFPFIHADWRKARRRGAWGIVCEIVACFTAGNTERIAITRPQYGGAQTGTEAEALLRRHGVPIGGRGFFGTRVFFSVPKRQARWAQWLIRAKSERGYEPPVRKMPRRRKQ